jgi:hypothetical protein
VTLSLPCRLFLQHVYINVLLQVAVWRSDADEPKIHVTQISLRPEQTYQHSRWPAAVAAASDNVLRVP